MQDLFKAEAHISVHPTKRGINKINVHHYFNNFNNFKYSHHKPISWMLDGAQFLHVLTAEPELLVNNIPYQ